MVEPQPTKKPEWNTGGANRTEPAAGEKTSGWVVDDQPPSSYFNWLQYYTYAWLEWLNERFYKGSLEVDLNVKALRPDTSGAGGRLNLEGGNANTSGAGGYVHMTAGDGLGSTGGDIRVRAGNSDTGNGGPVDIDAGFSSSGAGGDVTIDGGAGATGGGDVTIGGGDATAGAGGDINVAAGDSIGSEGGDVNINAGPSDTGGGGDVEIGGGDATASGAGGYFNAAAGDSVTGNAGSATLRGGTCTGTGTGGSSRLFAGNTAVGTGGLVDINGGSSSSGVGGSVDIDAGAGGGTDQAGGNVTIDAGASTGTAASDVTLKAAEGETGGSGSGSYSNTPQTYIQLDGSNKYIEAARHMRITDASATTRGVVQLVAKAQPTAPLKGDIYPDSNTNQLGFYNGTRYKNLDPLAYNISDDAITGENPTATASVTMVLNERPYGAGVSTTPLRHIIPANTLRAGSIIRVRALFWLIDTGGGSTYPSPKLYVGSVGAGPSPYTSPTGVVIFNPDRSAAIWTSCSVEADLCVRSIGASGNVDSHVRAWFGEGTVSAPIYNSDSLNTDTLDTTAAVDVFAAVLFGTSNNWDISLEQFIVDIL